MLGALAERDRPAFRHPRVDHPPAEGGRVKLLVRPGKAPLRLQQHPGSTAHRLDPGGDDQRGVAGLDRAAGADRRLEAGAAEPVDGGAGDAGRQARQQHRHAGDVSVVLSRRRWRRRRARRRSRPGRDPASARAARSARRRRGRPGGRRRGRRRSGRRGCGPRRGRRRWRSSGGEEVARGRGRSDRRAARDRSARSPRSRSRGRFATSRPSIRRSLARPRRCGPRAHRRPSRRSASAPCRGRRRRTGSGPGSSPGSIASCCQWVIPMIALWARASPKWRWTAPRTAASPDMSTKTAPSRGSDSIRS